MARKELDLSTKERKGDKDGRKRRGGTRFARVKTGRIHCCTGDKGVVEKHPDYSGERKKRTARFRDIGE